MTRALRLPLVLCALAASSVWAQSRPGAPPPSGTPGEEEPKPEGAAEKAPKETTQLPTLPPLPPYPGQEKKKFELVELDGYLRFRTSWFDNYHLGYHDSGLGVPFREPLTCRLPTNITNPNPAASGCSGSIGSANMRVRLEPTINVSENVSIHMLVDVLDNLVLGSTPDGVYFDGTTRDPTVPANIFSNGQAPPEKGKNSPWDAIRVKEAYGRVKTPLGELTFGRQPSQWGLGIFANAGGYDWMHGTYCTDCDYGDHVDRVMFGTTIPGTPFRAAIAFDWASSAPTAGQLDVWKNRSAGQPYDLEDEDDVTQWTFMVTRLDDPDVWRQTVKEGKTAVNFGALLQYRSQRFEAPNVTLGSATPETNYIARNASMYVPDIWGRLTFSNLTLETELVGMFGSIDNLNPNPNDPTQAPTQTIRMLGGVFRLDYSLLDDDLHLDLEVGFASGDQWEQGVGGVINVHEANYFPQAAYDDTITNFHFNFDYRPDLIFFREILGAVTNATYVKPSLSYNVTERFGFKAAGIASFSNVPVSTPGNDFSGRMYGIELDADVGYSNKEEGFFAGISYGVFFPFGALDHPVEFFPNEVNNTPSTAQTIQARLLIKF